MLIQTLKSLHVRGCWRRELQHVWQPPRHRHAPQDFLHLGRHTNITQTIVMHFAGQISSKTLKLAEGCINFLEGLDDCDRNLASPMTSAALS
jgi:hypothetical protein